MEKKSSNINNTNNEEINFKIIFIVLKRYWYVLPTLILAALITAFLYLRFTPNMYQARAVIQEDQNNNEDILKKAFSGVATRRMGENDILKSVNLITSPIFLNQVLDNLPLNVDYHRKKIIREVEIFPDRPFEIQVINISPILYNKPIDIIFETEDRGIISYEIKDETYAYSFNINHNVSYTTPDIKFQLIFNEPIKTLLNLSYFVVIPDSISKNNRYIRSLNVVPDPEESGSFTITLQHTCPAKASIIVNTITKEFQNFYLKKEQESYTNILKYIDEQLLYWENEVHRVEKELDDYKKRNNIDEIEIFLENIDKIQPELEKAEEELALLEQNEKVLNNILITLKKNIENKEEIDIYFLLAQIIGTDFQKSLNSTLENLQKLLLEKQTLLYNYTPNSGKIKQIDHSIETQKKLIQEAVKVSLENLEKEKVKLIEDINLYRGSLYTQQDYSTMMELKKLQNLVEVSNISYNKLLEAKISYSIIRAGVTSPYILLENATSALAPISPKRNMTYLISLIVALVIGFGFLFLKYLFYNEIRDVEDVTNYTDIPFLGSVPKYSDKRFLNDSQMIVDKHPKSAIAEAMRKLRTNLQFIDNEEGSKIISITSTIPGEGKTFVAINLAAIITYSGKKVIILDLDMRKPKIHKAFDSSEHSITNTKGMSNILAGTHSWEECLKESRLKNLHFITAGNIPPNPSELILSERMKSLIDELKNHYDFILIDNPPIGILADAMFSLQIADYPIYIIRSMYSYRPFILTMENLKKNCNVKNLSFVLNDHILSSHGSYGGYGYNYGKYGYSIYGGYGYGGYGYGGYGYGGYGYGYGYGYEEGKKKKTTFQRLLKLRLYRNIKKIIRK